MRPRLASGRWLLVQFVAQLLRQLLDFLEPAGQVFGQQPFRCQLNVRGNSPGQTGQFVGIPLHFCEARPRRLTHVRSCCFF